MSDEEKSLLQFFAQSGSLLIEVKVFIQVDFSEFVCTLRWVVTIVMDSK
jgi:hypothetical protein